jgi:hypothetical protein
MQPDRDPVVSEWHWFHVIADYLADRGSDQNLANALVRAGMRSDSALNFMRALLNFSCTPPPRGSRHDIASH